MELPKKVGTYFKEETTGFWLTVIPCPDCQNSSDVGCWECDGTGVVYEVDLLRYEEENPLTSVE